ncbi:DUF5362 family protein [Hymenobacter koreensis]|uniref:DUF5362 family protein n=1 Tax=Hymenobacter koreensis TaxID=1084523 RepID=A0ABP8IVC9_9BACT
MEHDYTASPTGLTLSQTDQQHLSDTRRWTKFLAIVGLVLSGFIILAGASFGLFSSAISGSYQGMGAVGLVAYLLLGLVYLIPCVYLLRFSSSLGTALREQDQNALTHALSNHKSFYKFISIFLIVTLVFYALALAGLLLFNPAQYWR